MLEPIDVQFMKLALCADPQNLDLWDNLLKIRNIKIRTRANPTSEYDEITSFSHDLDESEGPDWIGWPKTGHLKIKTNLGILFFSIKDHGKTLAEELVIEFK